MQEHMHYDALSRTDSAVAGTCFKSVRPTRQIGNVLSFESPLLQPAERGENLRNLQMAPNTTEAHSMNFLEHEMKQWAG